MPLRRRALDRDFRAERDGEVLSGNGNSYCQQKKMKVIGIFICILCIINITNIFFFSKLDQAPKQKTKKEQRILPRIQSR